MGKSFVCDTIAFIHLETDTYKKIENEWMNGYSPYFLYFIYFYLLLSLVLYLVYPPLVLLSLQIANVVSASSSSIQLLPLSNL